MRTLIVEPEDALWAAVLARARHDFYHLPGYVTVSARNDGGVPRALIVEDGDRRLLLPLVVREIAGGAQDACSPYGYPGPVQTGTPEPAFTRDALLAGVRFLHELGLVSLFIRMHPLLNPTPPTDVGVLVRHGDTVAVDVTLPQEVLWQQIRRNHRQQIRQALDKGYAVEFHPGERHLDDFKSLYRSTMAECSAEAYYHFDDAYFDSLCGALGERMQIAIASKDGIGAAAGMLVVTGDIVQMHLVGYDHRAVADNPTKVIFYHGIRWAHEHGCRILHLGGGRGGCEDSLFHFKAGFSPLRQPFHTIRVVIDAPEYARLVAERDPGADPADLEHRFPAYRIGELVRAP